MEAPSTRVTVLVVALAFLSIPTSAETASPWPSFRGPRGDGSIERALPEGEGPLRLEARWKKPLGSGYSGIAVGDGLIVTAAARGSEDRVIALDPESGEERWTTVLGPSYAGHDGSHDGPISTPALMDGRVFALSPQGRLVALDAGDGHLLWEVDLVATLGSESPYYGFASSPAVAADRVILHVGGSGGALAGFEVATGKLAWRTLESSIDAQSPIVVELAGRRQVVAMGEKSVVGVDPTDGTTLWSLEHAGGRSAMAAPSASPLPIGGDRLVLKDGADTTAVIEVVAKEGGGFEARKVHDVAGLARSYSPPARSGDLVVGFTARFLSAVEPGPGSLLWKSREPGDGFLVALDDRVVILTKAGALHLGEANADGWHEADRLPIFSDVAWTPPSLAGSRVFARSLGEIARVDVVRGQPAAQVEIAVPAVLAPLTERLAAGEPAAAAVDAFLAGKTPPLVDGDQVVFLWRGEAKDVAIGGEMIGMRREEPMHRLAGTDLFWWTAKIDRRARVSYVFYVDEKPTLDPGHPTVPSTILGPDLNWNRGVEFQMSSLEMPEWPGRSGKPSGEPKAAGRVDAWTFPVTPPAPPDAPADAPPPEAVDIELKAWLPPGYDAGTGRYPVAFVLDGKAAEVGGWVATIDRVVGTSVEPLVVVFITPPRMRDFERILVETLIPAIDARLRLSEDPAERALVGFGWSGYEATLLVFQNPTRFGRLGLQSPFSLGIDEPTREAVGEQTAASRPLAIYLEWGRYDLNSPHESMNLRQAAGELAAFLADRGWKPIGGEVWDGTDWASWSSRTHLLLESLFPLAGDGPPAALAAWLTAP